MKSLLNRIAKTRGQRILLLLLILALFSTAIYSGILQQRIINPLLAPLDNKAHSALKQSLILSSASFATARLIDRGIAFVSEAEVGVGVASIKPGQLLKPLQDMAVRYSDLMVLAMTSVGMQLFLLEFGKVAALPLFGSGIIVMLLATGLGPRAWRQNSLFLLRIFIALLIIIRIGIPIAAYGVASLSTWVLEPQRVEAQAALSGATAHLNTEPALPAEDSGALSWLKSSASSANEVFNAVKHFTDGMVENLVQLIVVYTLQTLVFPLLSLWLLWHLGRWFVLQSRLMPRTSEAALTH
ncbi:hypothetical protein [Rheinheimera sp. MMS21-TC3]|uniref:hypothetical protein n=1 Tax=Rheinheimera sp. MMS21-TC3 TaxID=3072790 RepID=UPI0028C4F218|nr:hypothetical protein [Rheinheimera sp. MMS21-TC3]WNO62218.1 hypothetical protein RDV63_15040 [Rheinheimera sp. MMS21-TC3]